MVALLLATTVTTVSGQSFRVALSVDDQWGVVSTELAAALRRLGDVEIVTDKEPHNYLLEGVVMCTPSPTHCDAFAASLRFTQPLDADITSRTISSFVSRAGPLNAAQDTALANTLRTLTEDYYKSGVSWVVIWLRSSASSQASEFVADLDRNCFERKRMEYRMITLTVSRDTSAAQALAKKLFRDPEAAKSLLCI